jgi:hypothetical protein
MWTQQGQKLVGTGATGAYAAQQGRSVALSADGNIAIVGGPADNPPDGPGAVWVFTRNGGVWNQQGPKLVGTGSIPFNQGVELGQSVALSADGNTVVVGGPNDNSYGGAAWVFAEPTVVFSTFSTKLTIDSKRHEFDLVSHFTLGSTSNGINPEAEGVTLVIGTFIAAFPPGSFRLKGRGHFSFVGSIDGGNLNVQIRQSGINAYTFTALAKSVQIMTTASPMSATLTVGDDGGMTATVPYGR